MRVGASQWPTRFSSSIDEREKPLLLSLSEELVLVSLQSRVCEVTDRGEGNGKSTITGDSVVCERGWDEFVSLSVVTPHSASQDDCPTK